MRIYKPVLSTLLLAGLAACATGGMSAGDSVARLEQQRTTNPQSAAVNRSLGIAYYKAARYPEARTALETATTGENYSVQVEPHMVTAPTPPTVDWVRFST